MEITSRKEAIATKESYYFTGIPCKHGHIAKRHVTGCACVECVRICAQKPESKKKVAAWRRTDEQREKAKQQSKEYHARNRESCLKKMKVRNQVYYQKHKEDIKKHALEYQTANATKRTRYKNEWVRKKIKEDPVFRVAMISRRMLQRALGVAGQVKYKRTRDYLPYTYEQLVKRIEGQFQAGMSWDNYGEWHIDHKTPLSYFIKSGITDPATINALNNLQPLWADENMKKGARLPEG